MQLLREVKRVFASMPEAGSGVVAVSGGADSVALLRALHELHFASLTVAHLNHQLRGKESEGDEAFVAQLTAELGLPIRVKQVDVASLGGNLEGTARLTRYAFLAEVAAEAGADWIATGHTADDQAETVLLRIIRGTGLQGLRGIPAIRGFSRQEDASGEDRVPRIVRPLLNTTRVDVLAYLHAIDQPCREDSSNLDTRFTRNRVRHELLPLLKTFNPEIVCSLGQLAAQAGEAFEVMEVEARSLALEAELPRAGEKVIFNVLKLENAHPYLVREMFRYLWDREQWSVAEMKADHWTRLVVIARGKLESADFPEGIRVCRVGRAIQCWAVK